MPVNPRVFVTGASGFVGSRVVRELLHQGVHTSVLLREPDRAWRIHDLRSRLDVHTGDLADRGHVEGALRQAAPTTLVHLAWDGVLGCARNDVSQLQNITTSIELAKCAAETHVETFVGLGSQAEYGPCSDRVDENTPTRPTTLYGAAKLATCVALERFCNVAGLRFGWLRLFSSYGPADNAEWMIPYLILSLLRRQRPKLTAGEQRWDYVYVDDAARAIVAVALRESASGVFNLGSGRVFLIRDIAETIRDRIDPSLPLDLGAVPYRPDQVMHLEANTTRLNEATGWRPQVCLDQGLSTTIDWYRENNDQHH